MGKFCLILSLTLAALLGGCVTSATFKTEPAFGEDLTVEFSDGVNMDFVLIDALEMWVGKYEVTLGQFRTLRRHYGYDPYVENRENLEDYPVVLVSWEEVNMYCELLDRKVRSQLPPGFQGRLPTGKEWEAFVRCGDDRKYPWGNE